MTRVWVELRSCNRIRRENDAITIHQEYPTSLYTMLLSANSLSSLLAYTNESGVKSKHGSERVER